MSDLSRKLLLAAAATAAAVAAMLPATSASAQDFDCKTSFAGCRKDDLRAPPADTAR